MDELFGLSMTTIMYVLLALLGVSLAVVGYVILRARLMFFMGLRNVPRRPAQTIIIIVGLMLSTLIISAAFTTGDTVDYSITNQTYSLLGHADVIIQRDGEEGAPVELTSTIPQDVNDQLRAAIEDANDPNIDGFLPILFEAVPVVNPDSRQSEPTVTFTGLDANSTEGFPDIISKTSGDQLQISSLDSDEVYVNESLADDLDTAPGDTVRVYVQNLPHEFTVADVVNDSFSTGVGDFGEAQGLVTRLDTLQSIFELQGEVSLIAISGRGGVRDSIEVSDDVVASLERIVAQEGYAPTGEGSSELALDVDNTKADLVEEAELAGNFMATFFIIFGLFSIAAGILLIVMIFVMLAAERKSEMGMARAVGTQRGHLVQMFIAEGMAYNILAAAVGAGLGVLIAFGMAAIMAKIFSDFGLAIEPHATLRSLAISYSLGVVLTFFTVTFSSWRVSKLNIVRAIRDVPEPPGGRMGWRWVASGVAGIIVGALLFLSGMSGNLAFPFALGFSLALGGIAVLLRFAGLGERPIFTVLGVTLLVFWGLTAGQRLEPIFGQLNGDVEMFFLSGIVMVTASTLVVIYNADLLLAALSRVGGLMGSMLPAVRTAVAYPLAYKFRTGMTLAMVSLVVFALTMMSTMNENFNRLFLVDTARGGWDVVALENTNNPIVDLPTALRAAGSSAPEEFRAVGRLGFASRSEAREMRSEPPDFDDYPVQSVDKGFIEGGDVILSGRARGYDSDKEAWEALATGDDVAIIDGFTINEGGFDFAGETLSVTGIEPDQKVFDPITIQIRDPISGAARDVSVVGVIDFGASPSFFGVFIPEETFTAVFGEPEQSQHYIGLTDPDDSKRVAQDIEATLITSGVQADSLKEQVEDAQALSRNFFMLMQAFMGLGLFVGIAAVGVVAFRTVVERRQQIGMLRAIGYKRSTVALSFVLESSFIAMLAVLSGVGLAVWLSYFLLTSDEFPSNLSGYVIPWTQIIFIGAFTYFASLLMTFIPSRQAANVPVAEALRYQ
ncbi:MAG: FtsX-like permease family protein [Dehalococcoidia bacterium]